MPKTEVASEATLQSGLAGLEVVAALILSLCALYVAYKLIRPQFLLSWIKCLSLIVTLLSGYVFVAFRSADGPEDMYRATEGTYDAITIAIVAATMTLWFLAGQAVIDRFQPSLKAEWWFWISVGALIPLCGATCLGLELASALRGLAAAQ